MSAPCKFELSILNHDEKALIRTSYHPDIGDADRAALEDLKYRAESSATRSARSPSAGVASAKERPSHAARNVSGTAEHSLQRKQVFVAALKRVNKEVARLQKFEARKELGEAARRALSLRRAQQFSRPANDPTSHEGMTAIPSRRRNIKLPRSTIGRVSQANKRAQAQRDSRR